jgi:hypothetical protein
MVLMSVSLCDNLEDFSSSLIKDTSLSIAEIIGSKATMSFSI